MNAPATAHGDDGPDATVKTIDRTVRLLRAIAAGDHGAMLPEVIEETGLGKITAHRLLNALIDAGLVFQDHQTKHYRLGAGFALLRQAAHRQDFGALAKPFLLRLAEQTEDSVYASVREGTASVCVGSEAGAFPIRSSSLEVGQRRPLGIGSGSLALLAFLPDDEIEAILEANAAWALRYPGHSRIELLVLVAETRRRGFSYLNGRVIQGMNGVGVAVLDKAGRPVGSLSLSAIAGRLSGARIDQLVEMLKREAAELGRVMGLEREPSTTATGKGRRRR